MGRPLPACALPLVIQIEDRAATQPLRSAGHTSGDVMRDEVGSHTAVMKTHNRKPRFSGSTIFGSATQWRVRVRNPGHWRKERLEENYRVHIHVTSIWCALMLVFSVLGGHSLSY